jgi:hypothetical protein
MSTEGDVVALRRTVRRRALANLLLGVRAVAERSAGRLSIEPFAPDALLVRIRDVRTLVRRTVGFALEARDFAIVVACPAAWPFEREAALVPIVVEPDDFAHPNSDGHGICVELQGVMPERLAALLYDNVRLAHHRLDEGVDKLAADYVRRHMPGEPADPRPLLPLRPPEDDEPPCAPRDEHGDGIRIVDVTVGVLAVVLPELEGPTILRLARPAGDLVDRARAAWLVAAGRDLQSVAGTWSDGPALAVEAAPDRARLAAEVWEAAAALRALGEETVARSYLTLTQPRAGGSDAPGAATRGE